MTEGLQNQLRFLEIVDKMKSVFRQSMLIDGSRYENDAEHSWHLALMAMILFEHCALDNVNLDRVIKMAIIHDLVEIYAGDTPARMLPQMLVKKNVNGKLLTDCSLYYP